MTSIQEWKERRSDELRDLILDAAARIFNEKGFERSTTKEVAREVGVSEGTIYNYFATKRNLLLSLVRRFAQTASELFDEKISEGLSETPIPQGVGARYFLERLQMFRSGLSPTLVFYHAKRDPEIRSMLEDLWAATMDERLRPQMEKLRSMGLLREIDLDFVGTFVRAIVFGLATMIDINPPESRLQLSLEEMSVMARDLISYGLIAANRRPT